MASPSKSVDLKSNLSSASLSSMANNTPASNSSAKDRLNHGNLNTENKVFDRRRLEELVKEVDPLEQLDDDVAELLLQFADDFIENIVTSSCQLAKHRKSNILEVKDVQLYLERNWNMWIPGFGSEEIHPIKKQTATEAHKQRMALIKKTLRKT